MLRLIRRSYGLSERMHGWHNLQRRQSYRVRQVEEGPVGGNSRNVGLFTGIRRHQEHGSQLCRGRRLRRHSAPHSALRFEVYTKSTAFRCNVYTAIYHRTNGSVENVIKPSRCNRINYIIDNYIDARKDVFAKPLYTEPNVIYLIILIHLIIFVIIYTRLCIYSTHNDNFKRNFRDIVKFTNSIEFSTFLWSIWDNVSVLAVTLSYYHIK